MDGSHPSALPDLKRRRFTGADVEAMLIAGVLKPHEPYELIGGDLISDVLPLDANRRLFTAREVNAMTSAGIIRDDERVELIGGELIEMSPQGPLHWKHTQKLVAWLFRNLPAHLDGASQGPVRLSNFNQPEPEFFAFPIELDVNDVGGPDTVLVVEVSHSSLRIDLTVKAPLYAAHGVREYWVVDVENRRTLVHRLNAERAYGEPVPVDFSLPITAPGGASLVIASLIPA